MAQNYIGVDLSKEWIDIFNPRGGFSRIANTDAALRDFLRTLSTQDFLVFEATSLCDHRLLRLASAARVPFHRINPLYGWHFSRSLNLPKTDRVDAKMLARMGSERQLEPSVCFDPMRAQLAELNGRRDQLKRMETQEKNRLHKAQCADIKADIRTMLRLLARRIEKAEERIAAFLEGHPELRMKVRLLETIPGIGRVTAVALLSAMPELGRCDRREAASLAGLAPRARESGRWKGRRMIGDGRRHVRRALYMAALSAMRHGSFCADFVARARAREKPGKVTVIAVARKMVIVANAILREQTPFLSKTS